MSPHPSSIYYTYPHPPPPLEPSDSTSTLTTRASRHGEIQKYHPDDLKGKGEPSYSIEKALKDHNSRSAAQHHRRVMSDGQPAYEMLPTSTSTATATDARRGGGMPRPGMQARSSSYGNAVGAGGKEVRYSEWQGERERERGERERESGGAKGLRKRIGSLRVRD